MKTWLVQPRDPLVIRNARPLGDGGIMRSLMFPWPSTVAGFVRTRIGTNQATGKFELTVAAAKAIAVRGPWLASMRAGQLVEYYVPAPRDLIVHPHTNPDRLTRTRISLPHANSGLREGEQTDLVGTQVLVPRKDPPRDKPIAGPAFWKWQHMLAWLSAPPDQDEIDRAMLGLPELTRDLRTHVKIQRSTRTAEEGMLFATEGVCFTRGTGSDAQPLSVAFLCDDPRLAQTKGVAMFGGERRISHLSPAPQELPTVPPASVGQGKVVRVVLITPAIFGEGSVPKRIRGLEVVGACVDRPESHSGWDAAAGGAKATRRMAPAGSVYWLKADSEAQAREWARAQWLKCVSDKDEDCLDGFGLCVVGVG